jgi:hypothetical protein
MFKLCHACCEWLAHQSYNVNFKRLVGVSGSLLIAMQGQLAAYK